MVRFPAALTATVAMLLFSAACDTRARREQAADEQRYREMQAYQRREDSARTAMRDFLRHELPRREAQWASHRVTRYRLAIRLICFCEPPPLAIVTVRDEATTVTDALGRPLTPNLSSWLNFSVPKLFAEVRRAVADTNWNISARFDSTYGFPIEFNTESRTVSDIGYRAIVEGFEALALAPSASR